MLDEEWVMNSTANKAATGSRCHLAELTSLRRDSQLG
jgi:hypothetical protein